MGERQADGTEPLGALQAGPSVPQGVPWNVLSAAGVLIVWMLLQVAAGRALGAPAGALTHELGVVGLSDAAALVVVWVLVGVCAGGRRRAGVLLGLRKPAWRRVLGAWKVVAAGLAAYVCVWLAVWAVVQYFGIGWREVPVQPLARMVREARSPEVVAFAFAVAVVIAPVTEEVLFRSVLYLPMRAQFGVIPAAAIVAVLFALIHAYPVGAATLVVLSVTFTALFERTGTLWTAIAAHGVYNGLTMVVLRAVPG